MISSVARSVPGKQERGRAHLTQAALKGSLGWGPWGWWSRAEVSSPFFGSVGVSPSRSHHQAPLSWAHN